MLRARTGSMPLPRAVAATHTSGAPRAVPLPPVVGHARRTGKPASPVRGEQSCVAIIAAQHRLDLTPHRAPRVRLRRASRMLPRPCLGQFRWSQPGTPEQTRRALELQVANIEARMDAHKPVELSASISEVRAFVTKASGTSRNSGTPTPRKQTPPSPNSSGTSPSRHETPRKDPSTRSVAASTSTAPTTGVV
jgi:hypothetical protein